MTLLYQVHGSKADHLIKTRKKDASFGKEVLEDTLASYEKAMFAQGQDVIRRSTECEATMFSDGMKPFIEAYNPKTKATGTWAAR
ncbi:FAD/NAD(P)-binding domain-containing protein [Penicillium chermesinum]|uniref:FAD/NAD(P)-binding domain-containing protein n=1 Tax=Penicillium chermesinum TaxID=63820 RepID=A0A9W9N8D2_9EURO|nr:FAD/NAD(P)-binding domain-containing protein [Penicillium chermesinum]KAJ5215096.1 FAD/NAD(P)-binding domain-containing protein [Penicillium chermesinum]KAJ6141415.1 FAD/NAD(P)-binding domain-containing protein [Penicillium chermesinum]